MVNFLPKADRTENQQLTTENTTERRNETTKRACLERWLLSAAERTKPLINKHYIRHSDMKIKYDKEVDIIYIALSDNEVVESQENKPGVIIDYDVKGDVVGIEVLNASKNNKTPSSIIYEFAD